MKRLLLIIFSLLFMSSCLGPNVGEYRVKFLTAEEVQLDEVEKWAELQEGQDAAILFAGDKNYEVFLQCADRSLVGRIELEALSIRHQADLLTLVIDEDLLRPEGDPSVKLLHITSRSLPIPTKIELQLGERTIAPQLQLYK